ncbi:hypothetical protein C4580_01760 [Candidatus Woesearchaeota archaeon]|nr:MAG: hypothetical protein C4580_01760 [Candidatus Woesearchaeota archaeon]
MAQKIFGLGLGATGIVGTLVVAGIILQATGISPGAGNLAVFAGVFIGIVLGFLGIVSVAKRVIR